MIPIAVAFHVVTGGRLAESLETAASEPFNIIMA